MITSVRWFYKISLNTRIILGLAAVCLVIRLINLTLLPIFTDESIYIYWARTIQTTHSQWFISLYDGKPPLLIWIISLLLSIFPHDWYLFVGRLPSVFAGVFALIGLYNLALLLFNSKKVAIFSSILYIIFPFHLLYDRMALFDSLLTSMLIWSVYFALKTAKTFSFIDSLLWGFFLGLGFLSKPTAIVFLGLTPLCFILLAFKTKKWKSIVLLSVIPILISEVMNNMQRVSHNYPLMIMKNQQFQYTIPEILKNIGGIIANNVPLLFSWILAYYTVPIFILGCIGFALLFKKQVLTGLILTILWVLPLVGLTLFGKELFPRYILFITPYFILVLGYFGTVLSEKITEGKLVFLGLSLFVLALQLRLDFFILFNPPRALLPKSDYTQYISEHPSGYGLQPIFDYLDNESKTKKIIVVTQGTFGLYPYAFNLHFWYNKNVTLLSRWPLATMDQDIYDLQKISPVYIVLKEYEFIPSHLLLKQVVKGEKPGNKRFPVYLTTFN